MDAWPLPGEGDPHHPTVADVHALLMRHDPSSEYLSFLRLSTAKGSWCLTATVATSLAMSKAEFDPPMTRTRRPAQRMAGSDLDHDRAGRG